MVSKQPSNRIISGGQFAVKLVGQFTVKQGGFFILKRGGQLHCNIQYDSAVSKTYPIYGMDLINNLNPFYLFSPKEKEDFLSAIDTIWDDKGNPKLINPFGVEYLVGLTFNHEWLYNSKANTIKSTITDADFLMREPIQVAFYPWGPWASLVFSLKFTNRTQDSSGFDQEALNPEIAWARDMLLQIYDDSVKGPGYRVYDSCWEDTVLKYTFNGANYRAFYGGPTVIKTTFNKKLVEWIWDAARKGSLPAYYCKGKDEIGEQILMKDMKNYDSLTATISDGLGNSIVVKNKLYADMLSGLEIKEEISFHSKSFKFESKITYAGILIESSDDTGRGIPKTSTILYWVKLN